VRNYLYVFLRLCADSREQAKRAPVRVFSGPSHLAAARTLPSSTLRAARAESASAQICVGVQSLKALDGCEKTLQAVWKRAARKRQAAGGQATPFGSPTGAAQGSPMAGTPMPPERMQKWGFLVKHERWLAVEGYSVTVSQKPAAAAAAAAKPAAFACRSFMSPNPHLLVRCESSRVFLWPGLTCISVGLCLRCSRKPQSQM
jgi:hypothetical protein